MTKWANERIDEGVLQWFGQLERMEIDKIAKRVYVRKHSGSRSVSMTREKWVDSVQKKGLDVR